ncbi:MAG: hypothetical protein LBG21_03145 [Campylobacteraceae bacterium]|jgi:hypothetical protein|nr:hypothetical protein [Campylobacteraceae bacterium]
MQKSGKFALGNRKIRNDIEEFIGQIFLWSFVVAAFILLQSFSAPFLHPLFYLPLCAILSIPIGFSVVIGTVALLNIIKNTQIFKR